MAAAALFPLALQLSWEAAAQPGPTLEELFGQVMARPSDAEVNIRYALEAERRGELRKALAAYERVVLNDPDNTAARADYERLSALVEPPRTRFLAGLGFQYDSNVTLDKKPRKDDVAAVATFRIDDDRRLGSQLWRSALQAYGDVHAGSSDTDFLYGTFLTGPVFILDNGWRLHPALTTEIGALRYDFLFWALGLVAELEMRDTGPLRSVTAGVSYADFARRNDSDVFDTGNGRDGAVLGLRALLAWDNVFSGNDSVSLRPGIVWNGADGEGRRFRFLQAGINLAYMIGLGSFDSGSGELYLAPEITAQYRDYAGREPYRDKDRADWRIAPGAKLIATHGNATFVLSYLYDRNFSNYDAEDTGTASLPSREYANHRVGFNIYWDF